MNIEISNFSNGLTVVTDPMANLESAALDKLPEKLDILPNSLPLLRQFISSRLAAWT